VRGWDATYAVQNSQERYWEGSQVYAQLTAGTDWSSVPGFFNFWTWYEQVARVLKDGDTFVEIGVWLGRSIIYLAQECRRLGKHGVKFTAVDTFRGEAGKEAHLETLYAHGGSLRKQFEANLERCGVADCVEIVESDSAHAAQLFQDGTLAGVFIDAAHDYESVKRDLAAWVPKVRAGGILSGHDIEHEPVQRAVSEILPSATQVACVWVAEAK
jgi:hypothetical protein